MVRSALWTLPSVEHGLSEVALGVASDVGRYGRGVDAPKPIHVVIVHPDRVFRESVAFAIDQQPAMRVVARVADADKLRPMIAGLDTPVFVLDLALPEQEALAQAREIKELCPSAAILMLNVRELESEVMACCEAGVTGCLTREASLPDLIGHLPIVAAGGTPCTPKMAALLFNRLRDHARELERLRAASSVRFTRRELEILSLIEEGLSNKEIACRLNIAVQTVKNHVHNILNKPTPQLGGRGAAVRYACERGLLD
jgi:two-component system, NarL family, nitrate/nitrite response regulator NarL